MTSVAELLIEEVKNKLETCDQSDVPMLQGEARGYRKMIKYLNGGRAVKDT